MRTFVVTFRKSACEGDYRLKGYSILVHARSEVAASWEAKAILCENAGAIDWRMVADECEVTEVPVEIAA